MKKESAENFSSFVKRLKQTLSRWFCLAKVDESKPEQVINAFVLEQLLNTLNPELAIHVREQQVTTLEEAVARRSVRDDHAVLPQDSKRTKPASFSTSATATGDSTKSGASAGKPKDIVCWSCGQKGHTKQTCTNKSKEGKVTRSAAL